MAQPTPPPRVPLITLRYSGGPPAPEAPVLEPTPDQQYEESERQRLANIDAKEACRKNEIAREEQQKGGTFGFKIGKVLSGAGAAISATASNAHAGTEQTIRNAHINKNKERFALNFPQLVAAGEVLITDYECKALHQGQKVHGHLTISQNFLCFQSPEIIEIIPLREITSARRSVSLETVDNGPPFVMIIPAPNVVPDTLQIFTSKLQLFQFLSFTSILVSASNSLSGNSGQKGTCFDRFFNFFDHAWRAATPVPVPGVHYAM